MSDNLAPAMGPTSRTASYGYTPSGRVMSGNGPWGNLAYGYDPSGNLTANGGTTMTVSPTSNQVTAVGGTVSRALTYLAGGELAGDAQTGRGALTYSYNAARRMTQVTRGGTTEVGAYAYDFAGRFVWGQTFGAGTPRTAYIHDQAGHVLAEENAVTGAASREYIWLDDKLIELVVVGTTDVPRYVTTGQIDEPQVMTQTSQTLAWNGYTDPFGAGTGITVTVHSIDMTGRLGDAPHPWPVSLASSSQALLTTSPSEATAGPGPSSARRTTPPTDPCWPNTARRRGWRCGAGC